MTASSGGIAVSKHKLALSPLINMYTGDSKARVAELAVDLSLSHSCNRSLTALPLDTNTVPGRVRQKTVDYSQVKTLLKKSRETRRKIAADHKNSINLTQKGLRKDKLMLKKNMTALNRTSAENILATHALN
eukprot:CAMPEP_0185032992 /NCGR_PEP_ID=MMETSP1103-20130426/21583_1 /TAXON_ID=36769 /ORGANISM="Paraphysomonas bandaiensis, Strain Caron Lab Isolate" /LENGTH=131 /DNA_ID=CAMNT_0027569111 /DNA_START=622 /DNA_END=1017 /DNA_ORIENTATION=-